MVYEWLNDGNEWMLYVRWQVNTTSTYDKWNRNRRRAQGNARALMRTKNSMDKSLASCRDLDSYSHGMTDQSVRLFPTGWNWCPPSKAPLCLQEFVWRNFSSTAPPSAKPWIWLLPISICCRMQCLVSSLWWSASNLSVFLRGSPSKDSGDVDLWYLKTPSSELCSVKEIDFGPQIHFIADAI